MKKLEVGKDYVSSENSKIIVIDCKGAFDNTGFRREKFIDYLNCRYPYNWREATEEEVIEAFEKHLVYRYGEDWQTMKIKEMHPSSNHVRPINDNSYVLEISKSLDRWKVWNKNGLLYCNGIWVERLEGLPKIHIKEAIKENTVIHCETIGEADRILKMAIELGYTWNSGIGYRGAYKWGVNESRTCYYLLDGTYSNYSYFKIVNYTIIPSTQIADLEPKKSSDWVLAPEEIEAMNKNVKASETQIGGSHYSDMAIQPIEFIHKNNLSFIQGNIIKYVCRYKDKGGIQDLNKAKHCIDLLIELEEENN